MISNVTDIFKENLLLCFPLIQNSCPRADHLTVVKAAMYTVMMLMILTTVLGNLLVIISISYFRQLQSPTHLIVRSLAASDCLLGSLVMPYSMVRSVEGCWFLGDVVCKVHSGLDMTLSISSILHLSLISVDRYWAVCDPLRYKMRVTNNTVAVFLIFTWLFSFVYSFCVVFTGVNNTGLEEFILQMSCYGGCVLFFNKEWGLICVLFVFIIPGTIMSFLYMRIFGVVRKHAKVLSEKVSVAPAVNYQTSSQRERKAAKTLAIIMGVFYICWLPFFSATAIDPFINFTTPGDVFDALVWFGYFNSTCNPLIYGFFYPRFQKAFRILISIFISGIREPNAFVFE